MGSVLLYLAIVVMWLGVLLPMWLRRDKHAIDDLYEDEPAEPAADADTVIESPQPESVQEADADAGSAPLTVPLPAPVVEAARQGALSADSGASGVGASQEVSSADEAAGDAEDKADRSDAAPAADGADRPREDRAARARRAARRHRALIIARRRRRMLWSILLVIASTVTAAVRVMPWWAVAPSGVLLVAYLAVLRVAVRVDAERRELAAKARAERLAKQRERRRAMEAMAREAEVIMLEARKRVPVFDQYSDQYSNRRAVGD
ncbi:divisome protein SepX/GlpR [Microtetraspora malaysiensis]|uniref:divisome protein SepX/GlpR n=1 Tax=Microtetraspora malaysiensis TaxID=161358 RepID=UPI003D940973